jgi:hypothetical protein
LPLSLALLIAASPSSSHADDFGTDNGSSTGPLADSAVHTYCWGPGFDANLHDNASWAMYNSLNVPTDMIDSFTSTCASSTDIWFGDANLEGGVRGYFACVTYVSPPVCNSGDVVVDPAELNIGINDEEDTTKSMCHEIGHSVGMTHAVGTNDCMRQGEVPDLQLLWRKYNSHHIWHVNTAY